MKKNIKIFIIDVSGSIDPNSIKESAKRVINENDQDVHIIHAYAFGAGIVKLSLPDLKEIANGNYTALDEVGGKGTQAKPLFDLLGNLWLLTTNKHRIIETVIISDLFLMEGV